MESNIISPEFNERRPRKRREFTPQRINAKIENETKLAIHNLKLFCIKNALWLVPLVLFLIFAVISDFICIFFIWKNPSILFWQIQKSYAWVLVYIAGLYTDELRRKLTKH